MEITMTVPVYATMVALLTLGMVLCGKKAVALSKEYTEIKEHLKQFHQDNPMKKKIRRIPDRIDTKSTVYSLLAILFCGMLVFMLYILGQTVLNSLL